MFRRVRRISMRCMKMRYMYWVQNHRKWRVNLTTRQCKRITIDLLERSRFFAFRSVFWSVNICAYSVLLAWTLSNGLLAAIITTTNDNGTANRAVNGYMAFLLFSVAGLACECWIIPLLYGCWILLLPSVVRFVGSTTYMIVRLFAGEWKGLGREGGAFCDSYICFSIFSLSHGMLLSFIFTLLLFLV